MILITKLHRLSQRRSSWLALLVCSVFFEFCALFFQHVMKLEPCVMCIYERIAMLGIGGAALIGLIAPRYLVFRGLGIIAWGYSAYTGLNLARQHVEYQFHPSPFAMCDAFVQLPHWAPLNHWIPWMFEAYGDCSTIAWRFINLSMPQWLVIIFAVNIAIAALCIVSQLRRNA